MEKLRIHEYFLETIQGEGFWSGCPADFIRLWGCPVGCSFCDTGDDTTNLWKSRGITFDD